MGGAGDNSPPKFDPLRPTRFFKGKALGTRLEGQELNGLLTVLASSRGTTPTSRVFKTVFVICCLVGSVFPFHVIQKIIWGLKWIVSNLAQPWLCLYITEKNITIHSIDDLIHSIWGLLNQKNSWIPMWFIKQSCNLHIKKLKDSWSCSQMTSFWKCCIPNWQLCTQHNKGNKIIIITEHYEVHLKK